MEQITLIRPDDWHCHFRDAEFLTRTVPDAATRFGRAIVMPNLNPRRNQPRLSARSYRAAHPISRSSEY